MLSPKPLGLPDEVEGIPFVMSLVLVQIIVASLMLAVTMYQLSLVGGVGKRTEDHCKVRRSERVGQWRAAFERRRQIEAGLPGVGEELTGSQVRPEIADDSVYEMNHEGDEGDATSRSNKVFPNAAKVSPAKPAAAQELAAAEDPMSKLTKAVLTIPPLVHYAVQSTIPKPTHPFGEGAMGPPDWIRPEDKQLLERSGQIDDRMICVLPVAYVVLWAILLLAYFT